MPSGAAHRSLAVATSPLIILGGWAVAGFPLLNAAWLDIGIVTLGYLANPMMLSPDMDLVHTLPSNEWRAAEPIWWGYQMLLHKGGSRNPYSHWPPLSSLIRVFYLWLALLMVGVAGAGIVNLIFYGLFGQTPISWQWIRVALDYWLTCFTFPTFWRFVWGICLGDLVHWVADISYSYMKR